MFTFPAPDFTAAGGIDCLNLATLHLCRCHLHISAPVSHSFVELCGKLFEGCTHVDCWRVEQLSLWTIRSMGPFLCARRTWADLRSMRRGLKPHRYLSTLSINLTPCYRPKLGYANQFSGSAVEDKEIAIFVEMGQKLAAVEIKQDIFIDTVIVPQVVRCELIMPAPHARIRIERDQRVGEQVIARPHAAVDIRRRIAAAPVEKIKLGIVRAGDPGRATAALPSPGPTPGL